MENMDNHRTKMSANSLDKNIPNATKFICPIYLFNLKDLGFRWKKTALGVHSPWSVGSLELLTLVKKFKTDLQVHFRNLMLQLKHLILTK